MSQKELRRRKITPIVLHIRRPLLPLPWRRLSRPSHPPWRRLYYFRKFPQKIPPTQMRREEKIVIQAKPVNRYSSRRLACTWHT